jgi:hypothetical protein
MEKVVENIMLLAAKKQETIYIAYGIPSFPELFLQHKCCKTIYQSYNQKKDHSDLVIFKLVSNHLSAGINAGMAYLSATMQMS